MNTTSIRILDSSIANQIAAGEVVDGPWSVVKELLENALDAGSHHIDIHIEGGGISRLMVTDDGYGMTEADARVCIQRHATSKLQVLGDLSHLASFGFRGEALAAIAAVSRMTLTTRLAHQNAGVQLQIEGGRILQTRHVGAPVGTRVEIRDLFFNTPARRKFLKTPRWENAAVERTVRDVALPAHLVGFCLRNEDKIMFEVQPAPRDAPLQHPQRMERAVACLGQNTRGMLYPLHSETPTLTVSGYLAAPLITRRDSRGIKLFVNQRCVNDPQLMQAVRTAYRTLLEVGRLPLCALNIAIPGTDVDVNVHPQKQHVRFREADRVMRYLIHTLREFLATTPWLGATPSLSGSPESSSMLSGPPPAKASGGTEAPQKVKHVAAWVPQKVGGANNSNPQERDKKSPSIRPSQSAAGTEPIKQKSWKNRDLSETNKTEASAPTLRWPGFAQLRVLGQVSQTFIVLAGPEGMVLLDQHAAHERVMFEELRRDAAGEGVSRQALLLPIQITLQPDQMQALHEHHKALLCHGLEVEPFGEGHAVIKALPARLSHQAAKDMVRDALAELHGSARSDALLERDDRIRASVACHGSIRAGQRLTTQEIQALLHQLDTTPFGAHCPHGRPIAQQFTTKHMARWFDRT